MRYRYTRAALTALRVSDSVEECGIIDFCSCAAQIMGAKFGAANYYADDGLRHERSSGGGAQGSNLEHQSRSEYRGYHASVIAHDVLDGALTISQAYRYFPPKTIHLVVVDPSVGTQRRPILVAGDQHYFVAPDNGVLSAIYEQSESLFAWHITSEHYFRQPVSNTFHGRDIFAPVAGWLSKNWQTASFGELIEDFVRFSIPKPKVNGNTIKCVVLKLDNFWKFDYEFEGRGDAGFDCAGREVHDSRGKCGDQEVVADVCLGRRGGTVCDYRVERIFGIVRE